MVIIELLLLPALGYVAHLLLETNRELSYIKERLARLEAVISIYKQSLSEDGDI
jgi:hypothetical protein